MSKQDKKGFFIILSPPRCKSTYLHDLFNSHPDITCHNEAFHHEGTNLHLPIFYRVFNRQMFKVDWRNNNTHLFIKNLIKHSHKRFSNVKLVGCKILLNEYQIKHGLDIAMNFNPKIVILERSNKLAWYSSFKIATETGVWITHKHIAKQHKITFHPNDYYACLEHQQYLDDLAMQKIKEQNAPYIVIDYDQLANKTAIKDILHFLGLPNAKLKSTLVRQNSEDILSRFNNPQEVIAFAESINQLTWLGQSEHVNQYILQQKQQIETLKQKIAQFDYSLTDIPSRIHEDVSIP